MLDKFKSISQKDKRILILGAIALSLIFIYLILIAPINHYKNNLLQEINDNRNLLSLMQKATKLQTQSNKKQVVKTGSLATLLQMSFNVVKIKPVQVNIIQDKAVIKFDHVVFDDLAKWIVLLSTDYQIKIIKATIEKQSDAGIVNAEITAVRAV